MTQQDYRLSPQQPNLRHLLQIFPVARFTICDDLSRKVEAVRAPN